ncbi:hypothetical protein RHSIM_Rhsim12G0011200 [Rhododendron simsii]|uniref:Uncharacterized protein n=1 Tax=Rhododendron simsii TaxID=118357 RepID=A0A834L681_RHOSS|nr:hypothetical protein RHSIM_Rhsim12G0011200 [Rhododendron simsii]
MSIVPDSDPREYRPPPPHEFKPVGLKLYKPKRNTFDRGLVLREPEVHFSGKNREIWSFEFLGMHVPKNRYADPSVIPRGLKWARKSREMKRGGKDLVMHRLFLDQLTKEQVNWDLWAMIDPMVHADLLRSRQATGQRILLEGPFCRQWYLGERVVRQSLGYNVFRVPKPIPFSMLNAKHLTMEDVERWTKGEDAATFLEEGGDYEEYRVKRLMPIFGAHPTSQTPRTRSVPTATGGEGAEVIGGASLEELPQLPEQVIYYSSRGHRRSVDIPSPENVELALAPSVQQVSREYVESCFRCLSGMSALIRQKSMDDESKLMVIERQSMMIKDLEARLLVNQDQRVASAGHSASAPQGERASTMGRGSGDDDRDKEDNEEEDDEEDNVGSEDEEEGEEESEEEDREIASREASPSGPSSKKPRRRRDVGAYQRTGELLSNFLSAMHLADAESEVAAIEAFAAFKIAEEMFLSVSKSQILILKLYMSVPYIGKIIGTMLSAFCRGHLKLAHQLCDELGVLASSVTGVDVELKTEASLRHARLLLAANQFSQVYYFAHAEL